MNSISTINGVLVATQNDFNNHLQDNASHVTQQERAAWNAKAEASQLASKADESALRAHETNATVHITSEEREKWNTRHTKGVLTATQDDLDDHTGNTTVHVTEEERAAWNNHAENTAVHLSAAERPSWESGIEWASEVGKVMKMTVSSSPSRAASLSSQEGLALGAGARVRATGAGWAMGMNSTCDCTQVSLALGHLSSVTGEYAMAVGIGAVCSSDSTTVISAYNETAQLNAALGLEVDDSGNEYLWVASFDHLMGHYLAGVRISLTKFMDLLLSKGGESYTPKGQAYNANEFYDYAGY